MHAFARQRVEIRRHGRDLRFALAGPHLGYFSLMQHDRAHDLNVEMEHERNFFFVYGVKYGSPLAQDAVRCLADNGKRLGKNVVERCAVLQTFLEFIRLCPQLIVRQGAYSGPVTVHRIYDRPEFFHVPVLLGAEHRAKDLEHQHTYSALSIMNSLNSTFVMAPFSSRAFRADLMSLPRESFTISSSDFEAIVF